MWMKNTYLPLDMLFLDREGRIVQIVEKTTPLSLAQIRSTQPDAAVLEAAVSLPRATEPNISTRCSPRRHPQRRRNG